jgi:hypothetical protein
VLIAASSCSTVRRLHLKHFALALRIHARHDRQAAVWIDDRVSNAERVNSDPPMWRQNQRVVRLRLPKANVVGKKQLLTGECNVCGKLLIRPQRYRELEGAWFVSNIKHLRYGALTLVVLLRGVIDPSLYLFRYIHRIALQKPLQLACVFWSIAQPRLPVRMLWDTLKNALQPNHYVWVWLNNPLALYGVEVDLAKRFQDEILLGERGG